MEPHLIKQIFYLIGIVIIMVVAVRLMKKVQDVPEIKDFDMENLPDGLEDITESIEEELAGELGQNEIKEELQLQKESLADIEKEEIKSES